jgi:RNA polymerase sigma factor (sigma-70 family)
LAVAPDMDRVAEDIDVRPPQPERLTLPQAGERRGHVRAASCEKIDGIRAPAALGGWLMITARRECLHMLESRRREVLVGELPERQDDHSDAPFEAIEAAERRTALHDALDRVPVHQQRLVRSILARPSLDYDHLSASLGIPKGSIGPTRARCLARLRRDPVLRRVVGAESTAAA